MVEVTRVVEVIRMIRVVEVISVVGVVKVVLVVGVFEEAKCPKKKKKSLTHFKTMPQAAGKNLPKQQGLSKAPFSLGGFSNWDIFPGI